MTMKNDAKFEEEFSCHFKTETRNLNKFWSEHLKVSKIFILMCSFWAKYIFFHLKKYRGLIFYETEEGYRIWKGIDLSFQNWQKEFDKFWPGHLKVPNIFTLIGSFWAKYILFELKKYRGVISHDIEEWCKIWRKTDLLLGKWHEKLGKFSSEHWKVSKIFTLIGSFWAKYILFELKKYRGVIFHETEEWCKIWRKTGLLLGKWHEEFGKFSPEHSKVSKLEL